MGYDFTFARAEDAQRLLPELFAILHGNMSRIAPTGGSYEEDCALWTSYMLPALREGKCRVVLLREGDELIGYFQYSISDGVLLMEEVQLKPHRQGTGVFRALFVWLVRTLPEGIEWVEAYARKENAKSQAVLGHMGLSCIGENKNGSSLRFRGRYADLARLYAADAK